MSDKAYQRYVEQGPNRLTEEQTKAALDFRDHNPAEAFEVRARFERERREAEEKEDLRDAWLKDGGSPHDFEAAHKKISTESKAERLRRMDEEAREAFALQMARGF